MKKFLRVALAVAVLACLASIAMAEAAPTGGAPQPQVDALTSVTVLTPWWKVLIAAFLSWLSH
jgi:urea transporter